MYNDAKFGRIYAAPDARPKDKGDNTPADNSESAPAEIAAVYGGPRQLKKQMRRRPRRGAYPRNFEEDGRDESLFEAVYAGPDYWAGQNEGGTPVMMQVYAAPCTASPEELWRAVNKPVAFCPCCGSKVTEGDKYCRECGNKLPGWDMPVNV